MEWFDFVFVLGVVITLIGVVLFVLIAPLERSGLGLPILLLGIIVMRYGVVLRVFKKTFKRDKMLL